MPATLKDIVERLEKLDQDDLRDLIEIRDRAPMKDLLAANLKARTSLHESANKEWGQATLDLPNAVLRAVRKSAPGKFGGLAIATLVSAAENAALGICARPMLKPAEYDILIEAVGKVCAPELLQLTGEGLAPATMAPVHEAAPETQAVTPADPDQDVSEQKRAQLAEMFGDDEVDRSDPDAPADEDQCSECGADLDDGEGYDGRCGSCADRVEGVIPDSPEPVIEEYPVEEREKHLLDAANDCMDAADHAVGQAKVEFEDAAKELVEQARDYAPGGPDHAKPWSNPNAPRATGAPREGATTAVAATEEPEPTPALAPVPTPSSRPKATGANAFASALKRSA